ncbi:RepA-like replication initiator [Arthrobacter phage Mufasa8]|uniref:RepA-like replication initiator n=1 Tax=Arthrobacter phage Mufasa8 TaxID=2656526 RepID=A0A649VMD1_9CAUD|nr:replication initiation protein [Arthrobacter phage Mufasa8]QGJ93498.1 RepA-like replication initiator [Arthrobacter phage Mufasa8]
MASEPHARILRSIWRNEDWLDLSVTAQWLYERLLSHEEVSLAGVVDWRPARLTQSAVGASIQLIEAAAVELAERKFIVFDEGTEEALIRSFVRNDGLLKQPNMGIAVAKAYAATGSRKLRGVLVYELQRLREDQPDLKGWAHLTEVLGKPSINPWTELQLAS